MKREQAAKRSKDGSKKNSAATLRYIKKSNQSILCHKKNISVLSLCAKARKLIFNLDLMPPSLDGNWKAFIGFFVVFDLVVVPCSFVW